MKKNRKNFLVGFLIVIFLVLFIFGLNYKRQIHCSDSDSGTNYYVKGTMSGPGVTSTDYCWKDYTDFPKESIPSPEERARDANDVIEYSCFRPDVSDTNVHGIGGEGDIDFYMIRYSCPNGCSNGACRPK